MSAEPTEPLDLTQPTERERAKMALTLGAALGVFLALLGRRAPRR